MNQKAAKKKIAESDGLFGSPATVFLVFCALLLLITPTPSARAYDSAISEIIKDAATADHGAGAKEYLKGKQLEEISYLSAAIEALKKNLSIKYRKLVRDIRKDALDEAEAAFYPQFSFSLSYSRTDNYMRQEWFLRDRINTPTDEEWAAWQRDNPTGQSHQWIADPGDPDSGTIVPVGDGPGGKNPIFEGAYDVANSFSKASAWDFDFQLAQTLPWGSRLNLFSLKANRWDGNDEVRDSWRRPWVSSLSTSFTFSLPYCKDFGPYGAVEDVNIKLARVDRGKAGWEVNNTINTILLQVDNAFWGLVKSAKRLEATIQNRESLEDLTEYTKELFEARRTTAYGKFQVEAELANVKNLEEIAWNDFFKASNLMANLLDHAGDVVFIPADYSRELEKEFSFDSGEALTTGLKNRPDLMAEKAGLQYQEIWLSHKRNQVKPDIKLSAGISFQQNNSIFGYRSWTDSLGHIFDPDSRNIFVGVTYRLPYGNKAAKAAYGQAKYSYEHQKRTVRLTEDAVTQEVNNALSTLFSAKSLLAVSRVNSEMARMAYESAMELRRVNRVSEFEIIKKSNDLLNADYNYINALIDFKMAEARLLAAQGVLFRKYFSESPYESPYE